VSEDRVPARARSLGEKRQKYLSVPSKGDLRPKEAISKQVLMEVAVAEPKGLKKRKYMNAEEPGCGNRRRPKKKK